MELVLYEVVFSYDRGLPTESKVLDSFSLTVRSGELLSVVGRTGSGKTTLGLIMAGLLKPVAGEVAFRNSSAPSSPRDIRSPAARERVDVVMVFQFPESQFFEDDVFSEIAFGPSRLGVRGAELSGRVASAMRAVGLDADSFSRRRTSELSEGEKRRVAIASALSCEPYFLILDEPTISLDWEASASVLENLRELTRTGASVVVMTHEVESAAAFSDRVAVLEGGRVAAAGSLKSEEILLRMEAGQRPD
jgi:energy-coupling factor transport system ATP-binding protein